MSNERYYSARPWEVILESDHPCAVKYRQELMGYLDEYPDGADKNDLEGRLRSKTESGPQPHPDLVGVTSHPDFAAEHQTTNFFLEAVLALESEERRRQEQRLAQMVDALRNVTGKLGLWAQLVTDLPSNFPLRRVRSFLEREIGRLDVAEIRLPLTITFSDIFQGEQVTIEFLVMLVDPKRDSSVVQAWGEAKAQEITTYQQIRLAVTTKANKYGTLEKPYIVAVWPLAQFPLDTFQAERALYGDMQINVPSGKTKRAFNGVFNTVVEGQVLNRQVSAVMLYRERFLERLYERQLCIYHNPYALFCLPTAILIGLPQFVVSWDEDGNGHMEWLDEKCPWDE